MMCAKAIHEADENAGDWLDLERDKRKSKTNSAKSWLNIDAVSHMTSEMLKEIDPDENLSGWLRDITTLTRM